MDNVADDNDVDDNVSVEAPDSVDADDLVVEVTVGVAGPPVHGPMSLSVTVVTPPLFVRVFGKSVTSKKEYHFTHKSSDRYEVLIHSTGRINGSCQAISAHRAVLCATTSSRYTCVWRYSACNDGHGGLPCVIRVPRRSRCSSRCRAFKLIGRSNIDPTCRRRDVTYEESQ
jgi:hypothetical protein